MAISQKRILQDGCFEPLTCPIPNVNRILDDETASARRRGIRDYGVVLESRIIGVRSI